MAGQYLPCDANLRRCKSILAGEHDSLPEQPFYMMGSLDQAIEKAQKLAG